ncbi:MAG TPA: nickel-dependent hydrogenase large subunit [Armatimonadota bacterium]|nr:nickel-dependent hydrogenase large subunit [Armatimonadota bacterium]
MASERTTEGRIDQEARLVPGAVFVSLSAAKLAADVTNRLAGGARFVALLVDSDGQEPVLRTILARPVAPIVEAAAGDSAPPYSVLSCPLEGDPPGFPTLINVTPAAAVFEREIRDLLGQEIETPGPIVDAPGAFQFSVGPVRSGVTEAQQFLFEAVGEEMLHLAVRLYFKHRGVEKACEGRTPAAALPLVERISGRSSFAHSLAFCQAVEYATGSVVPARAQYLRSVFAELERLYNHFSDLSDLCESTSLGIMNAQWAWLKEQTLRLHTTLGVSRYLRNINQIGGVRTDLDASACKVLEAAMNTLEPQSAAGARLLERTYSHVQRLEATGALPEQTAREYGCVGPVARASGIEVDARRASPYAAYGGLNWRVAGYVGGDALARMYVRLQEIEESFSLVRQCSHWLAGNPSERSQSGVSIPETGGMGLGWAETPRGEAVHLVRLSDEGLILRAKFRTPSVINWQPFPLTIEGIMMPDFAVNKASWNLSVAGNDL